MTHRGADVQQYMSQLDALRALADSGVLVHDFAGPIRFAGIDTGLLGVWLFFVLSGFLITGILFRSRDQADFSQQPTWACFPLLVGVTVAGAIIS